MIEELHRRNFGATLVRSYFHGVERFSRYFHRSPDQFGPSGAHPEVSGDVDLKAEVRSEHRHSASGSNAVLLHQGAEEELECCRDILSDSGQIVRIKKYLPRKCSRVRGASSLVRKKPRADSHQILQHRNRHTHSARPFLGYCSVSEIVAVAVTFASLVSVAVTVT